MAGGGRITLSRVAGMVVGVLSFHKSVSCDTLLAAEVCFVNGDLTTGTVAHRHAKEDEVAESVFPNVIFFFLKLNSSSHMRIINFHVTSNKFEYAKHKSSKLRKEIYKKPNFCPV